MILLQKAFAAPDPPLLELCLQSLDTAGINVDTKSKFDSAMTAIIGGLPLDASTDEHSAEYQSGLIARFSSRELLHLRSAPTSQTDADLCVIWDLQCSLC